jgi:hypothetical protein
MANFGTTSYAVSRTGKPVNVGDSVSITGTVTAITGTGAGAQLTILCSGATNGPTDPTTGAYSYTLSNTGAGTNVPPSGVYSADVTATQSL